MKAMVLVGMVTFAGWAAAQDAPGTATGAPAAQATPVVAVAAAPAPESSLNGPPPAATITHRVQPGETLWAIAVTYLGDGALWPQLYRLNKRTIKDPHWVPAGTVLRIPNGGPALADNTGVSSSPATSPSPSPATPDEPARPPETGAALAAAPTAPAIGGSGVTASPAQPDGPVKSAQADPVSTPAAPSTVAAADPAAHDGAARTPDATVAGTRETPAAVSADSAAALDEEADASRSGSPTLFSRAPERAMSAALTSPMRAMSRTAPERGPIHPGEHNGAPYIDRDGGPKHAGSVVGVADVSNVIQAADREHFALDEDVYITLPLGSAPEVGQRLLVYALGQSLGERGQIVVPTGILTVRVPGSGTVATTARITELFGEVRLGQGVLALDHAVLPTGQPTAVQNGLQTRVLWVENNQVLPTIGHYVVLDASARQGLRIGDQVTLYRARERLPESTITLPEADIAIATVVRVNSFGATALVLRQDQPAIEAGVPARVTGHAQ